MFQVKLGNTCFKTEICKKSLNPQWNSDWFRFEVSLSCCEIGGSGALCEKEAPSNGLLVVM